MMSRCIPRATRSIRRFSAKKRNGVVEDSGGQKEQNHAIEKMYFFYKKNSDCIIYSAPPSRRLKLFQPSWGTQYFFSLMTKIYYSFAMKERKRITKKVKRRGKKKIIKYLQ
jgi:hypothetical protein